MKGTPNASKLLFLALIVLFITSCSPVTKMEISTEEKARMDHQAALDKKHRDEEIARWKVIEEKARRELKQQNPGKKTAEVKVKKSNRM